jgi:TPR repeat protein
MMESHSLSTKARWLMKWRLASVLLVAFITICSPAFGDYKAGVAAYEREDYKTALKEFGPLAEKGDAAAQAHLGGMYQHGYGVPTDYAKALTWYRKAAAQGNARGQTGLGFMYHMGTGVPKDYAKALTWFRKAAAQGYAIAQNKMGVMYTNAEGVPKDYVRAHMWFHLAASQGDKWAASNRDFVAKRMTAAQIAEAERLAREWKPKKQ